MTEEIIQKPEEQNHWQISKQVGILLILLAGFTLYFVFVALMPQSPLRNKITTTPSPKLTPSPDATTVLFFNPSQLKLKSQQASAAVQKTDITIDTGKTKQL